MIGDAMIDVHLSQMQGVVGLVPLQLVVVEMEGETMTIHLHWITTDSRSVEVSRGQVSVI